MSKPLPEFRIGDLVWCRWSSIWWPAMISYDPHTAVFYKVSDNRISAYHLQYFGIVARRAWVSSKSLVPMVSHNEHNLQKKSIGRKSRADYEVAMTEAKQAFKLDLKQRKLKFIFNFTSERKVSKKKQQPPLPKKTNTKMTKSSNKLVTSSSLAKALPLSMSDPANTAVPMLTPPATTILDTTVPVAIEPMTTTPLPPMGNTQPIIIPLLSVPPMVVPPFMMEAAARYSPLTIGATHPFITDLSPTMGTGQPIVSPPLSAPPMITTPLSMETMLQSIMSSPPIVRPLLSPPVSAKAMIIPNGTLQETTNQPMLPPFHLFRPIVSSFQAPAVMVTPPVVSASTILPFPSEVKIEELSCDDQKDPSAEKETGSTVRNTRYSLRLKAAATKRSEEATQLPSQYSDPQSSDSGFETGSDLSVTPACPPPTTAPLTRIDSDPIDQQDPPNLPVDNVLRNIQVGEDSSLNSKKPPPCTRPHNTIKPSQLSSFSNSLFGKCAVCDSDGDIVSCSGHCFQAFHLDCLGIINAPSTGFICDECLLTPTVCFQCKKVDNENGDALVTCSQQHCDKHYHLSCISSMKTFTISKDTRLSSCGLHCCAKCTCTETSLTTTKLLHCIRCPLALHKVSCLVAGCEVLNDKQMICYRHLDLKSASLPQSTGHFNMNTCLDCGYGGPLVCCDFCSATYHDHCLSDEHKPSESVPEWLCPCCSSHDLPTYESAVMCKCGSHRWWPAEIVSDKNVPDSLRSSKPALCMFLVRFFATEQYFWTHHGRVIAFTEDCLLDGQKKKRVNNSSTKQAQTQAQYSQAFDEALACYWEKRNKIEELKQHKKESKTFIHMKRNKYLVPRPAVEWSSTEPCKCTPKSSCGPSSNCINRAIYTECSPSNCPVGEKCENQKLRLGRNAPTMPFHTGGRGWGLKATEDIVCGDFVVEYIGEVLNMEMVRERLKNCQVENVSHYYFLTLEKNLIIDASFKSNNARFINHSCDPNCQTQKWKVNGETRIGIFAIKDISAGEELTFDYRLDSLGNDKKKCLCGSRNCSGYLGEKPKNVQEMAEVEDVSPVQQRKRKRSEATLPTKVRRSDPYDDDCFVCKEGGKLLMCDYPECSKVYHTGCINLKKVPRGDFFCPRHLCVQCSSPTSVHCSRCPSAYCQEHQDNVVKVSNEYLCKTNCHQQQQQHSNTPGL